MRTEGAKISIPFWEKSGLGAQELISALRKSSKREKSVIFFIETSLKIRAVRVVDRVPGGHDLTCGDGQLRAVIIHRKRFQLGELKSGINLALCRKRRP